MSRSSLGDLLADKLAEYAAASTFAEVWGRLFESGVVRYPVQGAHYRKTLVEFLRLPRQHVSAYACELFILDRIVENPAEEFHYA